MESWIAFGRGPLFRIAFSLMLLGLLRIFVNTIIGVVEAYRRSSDKIINWREVRHQTVAWLFPIGRLWRARPLYSTLSLLFHIGLLLVPVFLAAHVLLWKLSVGLPGEHSHKRYRTASRCSSSLQGLDSSWAEWPMWIHAS